MAWKYYMKRKNHIYYVQYEGKRNVTFTIENRELFRRNFANSSGAELFWERYIEPTDGSQFYDLKRDLVVVTATSSSPELIWS